MKKDYSEKETTEQTDPKRKHQEMDNSEQGIYETRHF